MERFILILVALSSVASFAATGGLMPAEQQNALVQKYCAVCHTDAARNGGLTLEHFDARRLDPSLAAMMVSKLKTGALGAAGIARPEPPVVDALTRALIAEAEGSQAWTVDMGSATTASIARQLPGTLYRIVLTCDAASKQGDIQLSWSPSPTRGTLLVSLDGGKPRAYQVEGEEKMGNGQAGSTGPASVRLPGTGFPTDTLMISNLFAGETAVFPIGDLPAPARQGLMACFATIPTE